MNINKIRNDLNTYGNIHELYITTTFYGFRNDSFGVTREVEISILDMGDDCDEPMNRYGCMVKQSDGRTATGNNASTIEEALRIVHWEELDK